MMKSDNPSLVITHAEGNKHQTAEICIPHTIPVSVIIISLGAFAGLQYRDPNSPSNLLFQPNIANAETTEFG